MSRNRKRQFHAALTLTDSQPSATLNFEMVYPAPPIKLPNQRVRVPKP